MRNEDCAIETDSRVCILVNIPSCSPILAASAGTKLPI